MYTYVCVYKYVYTYICIGVYIYIYISHMTNSRITDPEVLIYVCTYILYIYMYIYIYVCVYTYVYIYIFTHIYIAHDQHAQHRPRGAHICIRI